MVYYIYNFNYSFFCNYLITEAPCKSNDPHDSTVDVVVQT